MTTKISSSAQQVAVKAAPLLTAIAPAQIREAEKLLKLAGYGVGKIDGKSTAALVTALSEYQAAMGLPVTGAVDALTLKKLRGNAEIIREHHKKHQDSFVTRGMKGEDIEKYERELRALGYDPGKVDGVYDKDLVDAVKAFKRDQPELKNVAGYMGAPAQKSLARELKALKHAPERRRLAPTKAQTRLDARTAKALKNGPLVEGSKGAAVKNIQKHLKAAGYDPQHLGGNFDERTAAAVKAFQRHSGLEPTGEVNGKTWKQLKKSYILSKKPAAPMQALGERSGAVKASEKLLKKMGYKVGKVDGLFDRRTVRAVKRFEKKHHLKQDGKIGTRELAKMKKVASNAGFPNKVLDIARRWLGFHEGAGNRNPFSSFFGRGPEAWCADFVSYCYTKAGKKLNQSYTPTLLQMLKNNGTWNRTHPHKGDIVMFDWSPGSGPTSEHTGIVEKVFRRGGATYVQTIEGNSSDRVQRNTYRVGDPRVSFGTIR
jgi:peptidoglycan hydrolase-like protein with peptidoglycan-binding domain